MILETARESMSRLQVQASALLENGDRLTGDQFELIARLKAGEADVNLSSPALVISLEALGRLQELPKQEGWRTVDRMLSAMLMHAAQGGHGVTRDAFSSALAGKDFGCGSHPRQGDRRCGKAG